MLFLEIQISPSRTTGNKISCVTRFPYQDSVKNHLKANGWRWSAPCWAIYQTPVKAGLEVLTAAVQLGHDTNPRLTPIFAFDIHTQAQQHDEMMDIGRMNKAAALLLRGLLKHMQLPEVEATRTDGVWGALASQRAVSGPNAEKLKRSNDFIRGFLPELEIMILEYQNNEQRLREINATPRPVVARTTPSELAQHLRQETARTRERLAQTSQQALTAEELAIARSLLGDATVSRISSAQNLRQQMAAARTQPHPVPVEPRMIDPAGRVVRFPADRAHMDIRVGRRGADPVTIRITASDLEDLLVRRQAQEAQRTCPIVGEYERELVALWRETCALAQASLAMQAAHRAWRAGDLTPREVNHLSWQWAQYTPERFKEASYEFEALARALQNSTAILQHAAKGCLACNKNQKNAPSSSQNTTSA